MIEKQAIAAEGKSRKELSAEKAARSRASVAKAKAQTASANISAKAGQVNAAKAVQASDAAKKAVAAFQSARTVSPNSRKTFTSDAAYERYLVDNNVKYKDADQDYFKKKAAERDPFGRNDIGSIQNYYRGMVEKYSDKSATEKMFADREQNARVNSEEVAEEIYGLADENGNTISLKDAREEQNRILNDRSSQARDVSEVNMLLQSGSITQEEADARMARITERYAGLGQRQANLGSMTLAYNDLDREYSDNIEKMASISKAMAEIEQRYEGNASQEGDDARYNSLNNQKAELQRRNQELETLIKDQEYVQNRNYYDFVKKNGSKEQVSEFESLMESKDDGFIERRIKAYKNTLRKIAVEPVAVIDAVRDFAMSSYGRMMKSNAEKQLDAGMISSKEYNEFLKASEEYISWDPNEDGFSAEERRRIDRIAQETYYGEEGAARMIGQAMDSTGEFLTQALLFNNTPFGFLTKHGRGSLLAMASQSATDTYFNNLRLGYDEQTSMANAIGHGTLSYMTERIGMDSFMNTIAGGTIDLAFGNAVGYLADSMIKQGTSEGLEEVVEWFFSPIVDFATYGGVNADGTPITLEQLSSMYDLNDAGQSFAVAFLSAAMTGASGGIFATYNQYTAITDGKGMTTLNAIAKELDSRIRSGEFKGEELKAAQTELKKMNAALFNFKGSDPLIDAVSYEDNARNVIGIEKAIVDMLTPDVRKMSETFQSLDSMRAEVSTITNAMLAQNNINVINSYEGTSGADAYLRMSPEARKNAAEGAKLLSSRGVPFVYDASLTISENMKAYGSDLIVTKDGKLARRDGNGNIVGVKMVNGYWDRSKGMMVLDPNATTDATKAMFHEITHTTESTSTYAKLRSQAEKYYGSESALKDAADAIKNRYSDYMKNEDATYWEKEAVAEAVGEIAQNTNNFTEHLAEYGDDFLHTVLANAKAVFGNQSAQVELALNKALDERFKDRNRARIHAEILAQDDSDKQFNIAEWKLGGRDALELWLRNEDSLSEQDKADIIEKMDKMAKIVESYMDTGEFPKFTQWQDVTMEERNGRATVVVKNGDYELNIDFSTICKKRKMMDKVLKELSKRGALDITDIQRADMTAIRQAIMDNGLEVACALCFVDAKRFNQGIWAGHFAEDYNDIINTLLGDSDLKADVYNYISNRTWGGENTLMDASEDQMDQEGLKEIKALAQGKTNKGKMAKAILENPELRRFVKQGDFFAADVFDKLRDSNSPLYDLLNIYQGSAKPKNPHTEVTYDNQIRESAKFKPEKAFEVGGVRFQSFSDFMANMVFDYIQAFADMEAKGLPGHSYTKVPTYAKLFGKTGMKINLSLIPKAQNIYTTEELAEIREKNPKLYNDLKKNAGLDENGNYLWDIESFGSDRSENGGQVGFELAKQLRSANGYESNVGTICVGVSDAHIRKLLNDSDIDMVIPYHKSSINPAVAAATGIDLFNDYTRVQNTRYGKSGRKVRKSAEFNFYKGNDVNGKHYPGLIELGYDAKAAADSYLEYCKDRGYIPKFDDFKGEPNYYKLLIDFKAYDSKGIAPQQAVRISGQDSFPEDFSEILGNALQEHEAEQSLQDSLVGPISDTIEERLKAKAGKQFSIGEEAKDDIQYSIGGNSGYVGYSMSVRARNAYDDGRKPISKFTREDLDSFNAMLEENGIDAKVASVKALKDILGSYDRSGEWHHTSKYGNRTKFYDPERALDSILELDNPEEAIRIANTIGTEEYRKQESERRFREEHDGRSFEEELAYEREQGAKRDREILSRTTSPLGRRYAQAVVDWRDGKKKMYEALSEFDKSESGNIYEKGRKPTPYDYDNGLENFFRKGERRTHLDWDSLTYVDEVWDGSKFVRDPDVQYRIGENDADMDIMSYIENFGRESLDALIDEVDRNDAKANQEMQEHMEAQGKADLDALIDEADTRRAASDRMMKQRTEFLAEANRELNPNVEEDGTLGITDKDIENLLSRNGVSERTFANIESIRSTMVENVDKWVPNADVIKAKYGGAFTKQTLDTAIYEAFAYGDVEPDTRSRMREDLIAQDVEGTLQGLDIDAEVNSVLERMVTDFLTDVLYKRNPYFYNKSGSMIAKAMDAYDHNPLTAEQINEIKNAVKGMEENGEFKSNLKDDFKDTAQFISENCNDLSKFGYFGTLEQNLLKMSGYHQKTYARLNADIVRPRERARARMLALKSWAQDQLNAIRRTGITKNTKESQAVQWIMEGHTEKLRTDLKIDGDTTQETIDEYERNPWEKYDEEMLRRDFDYKMPNGKKAYENILDAAEILQKAYAEMIDRVNSSQMDINGTEEAIKGELRVQLNDLKIKADNAMKNMKALRRQMADEGTTPELEAALKKVTRAYNSSIRKYNKLSEGLSDNDAFRRQLTPVRKNYAPHYREQNLKNMLKGVNEENGIPTELAGVSSRSRPNTGFASFMIQQGKGEYNADAIKGFERYMDEASRLVAYNPVIVQYRALLKDLREQNLGTTRMSRFTAWLDEYTNTLAGKRTNFNRSTDEQLGVIMRPAKMLTRLGAAAALKFNVRSALVQFGNIPNGLGILASQDKKWKSHVYKGVSLWAGDMKNDARLIDQSPFMASRFFDYDDGDRSFRQKMDNVADFMMTKGDQIAAEMIWYSAYVQSEGNKLGMDSIEYADYVTRSAIAGRDHGDIPIAMQQDIIRFLLPFQIEVNNQWQTMARFANTKNAKALATIFIASFILNQLFRGIGLPDDPLSDPITPVFNELTGKESVWELLSDASKGEEMGGLVGGETDIGTFMSNVILGEIGEAMSAMPGGSYIGQSLGDSFNEAIGDHSPSRYGSGTFGLTGIGDIFGYMADGNLVGLGEEIASNYLPGGTQAIRTAKGLQSMGALPKPVGKGDSFRWDMSPVNYTSSGKRISFVNDPKNVFDWMKAAAFGKWATGPAQDYIESGFKSASPTASNVFQAMASVDGTSDAGLFKEAMSYGQASNESSDRLAESLKERDVFDEYIEQMNRAYEESDKSKTYYQFANTYGLTKKTLAENGYSYSETDNVENQGIFEAYDWNDEQKDSYQKAIDIEPVLNEDGTRVRNSEQLATRRAMEEAGIYDDVIAYISENGIDPADYGLGKQVMSYDSEKFAEEYEKVFGKN